MYIDRINSVIDYIESHLTDEISYRELAALLAMSVYELRRIFAFMVGTPLSDYIRQRDSRRRFLTCSRATRR